MAQITDGRLAKIKARCARAALLADRAALLAIKEAARDALDPTQEDGSAFELLEAAIAAHDALVKVAKG